MTIATGIYASRPSISTNTFQEPEVTLTLATDNCPTVAFYVAPAKSCFMSQDASSFFFLGGEHDEVRSQSFKFIWQTQTQTSFYGDLWNL